MASTKNGLGSLWVVPPTVTRRSCMASSMDACVLGGVRLISSARTMLENTGREELELLLARGRVGVDDLRAGDVAGHQVGRELDALEGKLERLGQRGDEQRLGQAGHAHEQSVITRKDGNQDLVDDIASARRSPWLTAARSERVGVPHELDGLPRRDSLRKRAASVRVSVMGKEWPPHFARRPSFCPARALDARKRRPFICRRQRSGRGTTSTRAGKSVCIAASAQKTRCRQRAGNGCDPARIIDYDGRQALFVSVASSHRKQGRGRGIEPGFLRLARVPLLLVPGSK